MRYFEDFQPGEVIDLGTRTLTGEEIVAFAEQFDPQSFHVDAEAAEASPFGGLIASGWHTASVFMRLYVDEVLADAASQGSPGVEELRWRRPVRPGMTLKGRVVVEEARPSSSNPSRGTLLMRSELVDDEGEVVFEMRARGLFGRRPSGDRA